MASAWGCKGRGRASSTSLGVRVGVGSRTATVGGMVCSTLYAFPEALTLRATFHGGPGVYALGLFVS